MQALSIWAAWRVAYGVALHSVSPGMRITYEGESYSSEAAFVRHWLRVQRGMRHLPAHREMVEKLLETCWYRLTNYSSEIIDWRFEVPHKGKLVDYCLHTADHCHLHVGATTYKSCYKELCAQMAPQLAQAEDLRKRAKRERQCRLARRLTQKPYHESERVACNQCGTVTQVQNDHGGGDEHTFRALWQAFRAAHPDDATLEEPESRLRWKLYHAQSEQMQPLCKQCHATKTAGETGRRARALRA